MKWAAVATLLRGGGCRSNCAQGMHSLFVLWLNEGTQQGRPERVWAESGSGAKKHRPDVAHITSIPQKEYDPTMQVVTSIFKGELSSKRSFVLFSQLAQASKAEALAASILVSPGPTLAHVP